MKLQESSHEDTNDAVHNKGHHNENIVAKFVVVFRDEFVVEAPDHCLVEIIGHCHGRYITDNQHVDEEKEEVFSIPETDAIVDPGAMMIHVKYTSVASRTVMASFRLEHIAHEAVTTTLVLIVSQVEAPENRDLSRIRRHRLKERP